MSEIDLRKGPKPGDLIAALSEGILGYIIYQARCGLQEAYSEYLLYDPIVRISKDKNWIVDSEYTVEKIDGPGDDRKIDFLCTSGENLDIKVGIEVKYLKSTKSTLSIANDRDKLLKLKSCVPYSKLLSLIIVAGLRSDYNRNLIEKEKSKLSLKEKYNVEFKAQRRKYGVTVLEVYNEKK